MNFFGRRQFAIKEICRLKGGAPVRVEWSKFGVLTDFDEIRYACIEGPAEIIHLSPVLLALIDDEKATPDAIYERIGQEFAQR